MQSAITEQDLIVKFRDAKEKVDALKLQLSEAQRECDEAENKLLELMQVEGKESSARYEGLGFVTMMKPALYANYLKENEDQVFEYLRTIDRADLIKETVNTRSLSSFVKESLEKGVPLPEIITYYLKPSLRFYAAK